MHLSALPQRTIYVLREIVIRYESRVKIGDLQNQRAKLRIAPDNSRSFVQLSHLSLSEKLISKTGTAFDTGIKTGYPFQKSTIHHVGWRTPGSSYRNSIGVFFFFGWQALLFCAALGLIGVWVLVVCRVYFVLCWNCCICWIYVGCNCTRMSCSGEIWLCS